MTGRCRVPSWPEKVRLKRCGSWKSSWCVRVRVFMCVCVCLCVSIHRTTEECTDARITPQMQVLVSVQVPQKKSCLSRFPLGAGPLRAGLNVFTGPFCGRAAAASFCGRVAAAKRPQNGPTAPANLAAGQSRGAAGLVKRAGALGSLRLRSTMRTPSARLHRTAQVP